MNRLAYVGLRTHVQTLLFALVAAGLGISIAYQPLFTVIAVTVTTIILMSVLSPQWISYLLLGLSAGKIEPYFRCPFEGSLLQVVELHPYGRYQQGSESDQRNNEPCSSLQILLREVIHEYNDNQRDRNQPASCAG